MQKNNCLSASHIKAKKMPLKQYIKEIKNGHYKMFLIINPKTKKWKVWSCFIIFLRIVSSFYYAYIEAFWDPDHFDTIVSFEAIFGLDFLFNLVLSYPQKNSANEKDIKKIITRYY